MLSATSRASDMVSIGSPWRMVRTGLQHMVGHASAGDIVKYGAILLAVVLAFLMIRAGTSELRWLRGERSELRGRLAAGARRASRRGEAVAASNPRTEGGSGGCGFHPPENTVLALVVAWLFAWPYVLPWYDAFGWAFLALVPASGLDWLMLARTAALGLAYLPARTADVTLPHGLHWVQPVFRNGVAPVVLLCATVWLVVIIVSDRYSALGDIGSVRSDRTVRGGDRHPDGDDCSSARHEGGQGVHGADRGQRRVARDG